MKPFKRVFSYYLLLFFFTMSYGLLFADNNWPNSFTKFYFRRAGNEIINMFDDNYVRLLFNRGYNPGTSDRSPINTNFQNKILEQLIPKSNEALTAAVEQVKNCSAFNDLFGESTEKALSTLKNGICYGFQGGDATINSSGFFLKMGYLGNFLYHLGKQAREIENGQRSNFDLTSDHFDINQFGDMEKNSIVKSMAHEMMHWISGFNGGGREAECIVHCLSKKCSDSNHDFTDVDVPIIDLYTMKSYQEKMNCQIRLFA